MEVPERSKGAVCKTVKPWVQIPPSIPLSHVVTAAKTIGGFVEQGRAWRKIVLKTGNEHLLKNPLG